MRKGISRVIATLFLLLSFSTLCFAEFQPDSNRWVWIDSNSVTGTWYDSWSVSVNRNYNKPTVNIWILQYRNTPEESVSQTLFTVDIKGKKLYLLEAHDYNMQGKMTKSLEWDKYDDNEIRIVPGSLGEAIYYVAMGYYIKSR